MRGRNLSTLIVQDYCQVGGGAERLVLVLVRRLQGSELWTSGVYDDFLKSGIKENTTINVLARHIGFLPRQVRALLCFTILRRRLPVAESVIYSGIFSPLAVRRKGSARRICYCHTPPKFAYEQKEKYRLSANRLIRPFFSIAVQCYSWLYLRAMGRMDVIITNSHHVQGRIRSYLGLPSQVVYPPVDVELFRWRGQADYYLSLGRLEPNKRVELIVEAFRRMPDKKLVVASGGSQLEKIKKLSEGFPNISVLGWVDDQELVELIGRSISCIYIPENEDFGMSAVEAMAAGKPVIAVADGGLIETVTDNETGYLLPKTFSIEDLCSAVKKMDSSTALAMRQACEHRSLNFSKAQFVEQIVKILSSSKGG